MQHDANGDSVLDLTASTVTVLNADGSRTTTSLDTNADGSLSAKSVATVSANGLAKTIQRDLDGNGTFEVTDSESIMLAADGSRATTRTRAAANGAILERMVVAASATALATTIAHDVNGAARSISSRPTRRCLLPTAAGPRPCAKRTRLARSVPKTL